MLLRSKSLRLILPIVLSTGCEAQFFTVRTKGVAKDVRVHYELIGSFGGYAASVRDADKDGTYRISLVPDLREPNKPKVEPAKSLKAIIWAPGCQFQLISVDSITDDNRSAVFDCVPLSTITLSGAISPPPVSGGPLDLEVWYMALWDHAFLGIVDGPVTQFQVTKVPLSAGGRFQIRIPNFAQDLVTNERQEACLKIRVLEHTSWNPVANLTPPADLRWRGSGDLKIMHDYGSEIPFGVSPH